MAAIAEADVVLCWLMVAQACNRVMNRWLHLRTTGKPFHLVVNKIDGVGEDIAASDFYQLGVDLIHPIAASHNRRKKADQFGSLALDRQHVIRGAGRSQRWYPCSDRRAPERG